MDDLISRQAAIDAFKERFISKNGDTIILLSFEGCKNVLEKLPSAQPERKKGRWNTYKESPEYATCSVCGHCDWDCTESEYFNYCPNCGAEMKGEQDG